MAPSTRLLLAVLLIIIPVAPTARADAASCPAGYTARFTVQNNCSDAVWMVETAPGAPLSQPAVLGQWSWFNQYATQFGGIGIGTGSISAGSNALTWNVPGTLPVAGVTITVPGAGVSGAAFTTTIVSDSASGATLGTQASTTVSNVNLTVFSGQAAMLLPASQASPQTLCVPDKGAPGGNFRFFMDCPSSNTDPFSPSGCTIGALSGALAGVNTLFEPTFGCSPSLSGSQCAFNPADPASNCQSNPNSANCSAIASSDNIDISAVNGYTMPMTVTVSSASCNRPSTDASMLDLASCPSETSATLYSTDSTQQGVIATGISLLSTDSTTGNLKGCAAPFNWFISSGLGSPADPDPSDPSCSTITSSCFYQAAGCNTADPETQCPCGSGPQQKVGPQANGQFAIQNTNWVQNLFALGYGGYTWQYGDGVGDQSCNWGGTIALMLCPNGGTPYSPNVLWTFSPTTATCGASGTGTPDNTTTFGSLIACQQSNMLYTCQDLTQSDPFGIASAMWSADPSATLAGTGTTYGSVQTQKAAALDCGNLTVDSIPSGACNNPGGTMTLAECNYLYGPNNTPCASDAASAVSRFPVRFEVKGKGSAHDVGSGRDKGEVRLKGTFFAPRPVRLDRATLTLWRLLSEVGAIELMKETDGSPLLPLTLVTKHGGNRHEATYEVHADKPRPGKPRPGKEPPSVQVKVSTRPGRSGEMEFDISVSRAIIGEPGLCAGRPHPTTILETRFTLDDGAGLPVQVDAKLPWECRKRDLVTSAR